MFTAIYRKRLDGDGDLVAIVNMEDFGEPDLVVDYIVDMVTADDEVIIKTGTDCDFPEVWECD